MTRHMSITEDEVARRESRAEFWKRLAVMVVVVYVIGLTVLVLLSLTALRDSTDTIRQTQQEGSPTGKRIVSIAESIESCTTPDGACYQRQTQALADNATAINTITVYAVTCANELPAGTVSEVQSCVQRLLEADTKKGGTKDDDSPD